MLSKNKEGEKMKLTTESVLTLELEKKTIAELAVMDGDMREIPNWVWEKWGVVV